MTTVRFGRQWPDTTRVARKRTKVLDAHVGSRVRLARTRMGISQTRLGELLGLTFQQIQKYENGTNRVSAGRLFQISQIFDVPIGYFYEGLAHLRSPSHSSAHSAEMRFFSSAENTQLAIAFMCVTDPKTRKRIVEFVKSLAEEDAPEKRVTRR